MMYVHDDEVDGGEGRRKGERDEHRQTVPRIHPIHPSTQTTARTRGRGAAGAGAGDGQHRAAGLLRVLAQPQRVLPAAVVFS